MVDFENYKLRISDIYLDSIGNKCVNFDFSEKDNEKTNNKEYAYFEVQLDEDCFIPTCYDSSSSLVERTFKKLFVSNSNLEVAELFGKELEWKKIEREYNEN